MSDVVQSVLELGFPWQTFDPFLFCAHHDDAYPPGNETMGPQASLAGRNIGMDFGSKDGWNMYHGDSIPGFPRHPHRGFETVTLVRSGLIDHADSLGATARFGHGDAQWLTAGKGIVHSEMFPLVERERDNPLELFQIWLNLPRRDKMVDPHFAMLWDGDIPKVEHVDGSGNTTRIAVVAGQLGEHRAPPPPPESWASRPESDLAIWTLKLAPGARFTLPAAQAGTNRTLYFFRGKELQVAGTTVPAYRGARLRPDVEAELVAGPDGAEILLLQGRPIGEPVAHHGPFVMNDRAGLQQAVLDYQATGYGGWPWDADGPVHARDAGRFAIHADGRREEGRS